MTKVMIVDDEQIICQLISRLIDYVSLHINLCAMATSSEEALRTALEMRPDIIITDINMPVMNGLELIRNLVEAGLETTYVIISGYQSFDYAYTAIKYGVTDFLLKPIDRDELNHTLKKIIDKKTAVEHTLQHFESVDRMAQSSRQSIRRQLVLGLSYPQNADTTCEQFLDTRYFDFGGDTFYTGILQLDIHAEATQLVQLLLSNISEKLKETLQPVCDDLECAFQANALIFVLNPSLGKADEIPEKLSTVLSHAMERIREYRLSVTIGLSSPQRDVYGLHAGYREATYAIRSRPVLGQNKILHARDCNIIPPKPFAELADSKPLLARHIEILDSQALEGALHNLIQAMHQYLHSYPFATHSLYVRVAKELYTLILSFRQSEEEPFNDKSIRECFASRCSLREYDEALQSLLLGAYAKYADDSQRRQSKSVALAKRYIAEHYAESITLDMLAKHVHLNPAYLGILFKKNEGINYSDHILNVRVDMAKELLKDTQDPIQAIAKDVGYSDARYFSKLFARMVGIKPSEYRRIHAR